jgi:glucose/arabinose dehydrogenase
LNRPEPGRNYGWPLVSWGKHYNGKEIPDPPTRPDLADAVRHWVPAISPSGMSFYDGALFPAWRGDLLIGGLSSRALVRLNMENGQVAGEERISMGARVRDVQPGPDGAVYLLIDRPDGEILRVTPAGGAKP